MEPDIDVDDNYGDDNEFNDTRLHYVSINYEGGRDHCNYTGKNTKRLFRALILMIMMIIMMIYLMPESFMRMLWKLILALMIITMVRNNLMVQDFVVSAKIMKIPVINAIIKVKNLKKLLILSLI